MRAGDFTAIPSDLDFAGAADLAQLIDGYSLTGSVWKCRAILKRVLKQRLENDPSGATALDVWIALFCAHRRHHNAGTWPDGMELWSLDMLALELRAGLLALTPSQTAGIMAAMRQTPLGNTGEAGHG